MMMTLAACVHVINSPDHHGYRLSAKRWRHAVPFRLRHWPTSSTVNSRPLQQNTRRAQPMSDWSTVVRGLAGTRKHESSAKVKVNENIPPTARNPKKEPILVSQAAVAASAKRRNEDKIYTELRRRAGQIEGSKVRFENKLVTLENRWRISMVEAFECASHEAHHCLVKSSRSVFPSPVNVVQHVAQGWCFTSPLACHRFHRASRGREGAHVGPLSDFPCLSHCIVHHVDLMDSLVPV